MKSLFVSFVLTFTTVTLYGQQSFKLTYQQLKQYEGVYEYVNHTTLRMAASPKDTILYAIINQSRYALKPSVKDLFFNAAHQPIKFLRNGSNLPVRYTAGEDTFKLITVKAFLFLNKCGIPGW